jgi:transposase-like protein
MARPRGKNKVVCQNPECGYYRRETGKDIVKRGTNRAGHRQYFCFHCNKYFAETKGTPLYNRKMGERKIKAICKELVEKKGVRAIERTHSVHRDTVSRLIDDIATHAVAMSQYMVHDLGLGVYEADEILTFIKKNRKRLTKTQQSSLDEARRWLRQLSSEDRTSSPPTA